MSSRAALRFRDETTSGQWGPLITTLGSGHILAYPCLKPSPNLPGRGRETARCAIKVRRGTRGVKNASVPLMRRQILICGEQALRPPIMGIRIAAAVQKLIVLSLIDINLTISNIRGPLYTLLKRDEREPASKRFSAEISAKTSFTWAWSARRAAFRLTTWNDRPNRSGPSPPADRGACRGSRIRAAHAVRFLQPAVYCEECFEAEVTGDVRRLPEGPACLWRPRRHRRPHPTRLA